MNPKYLYNQKRKRLLRNSIIVLLLMVAIIYGVTVFVQLNWNPLLWTDTGREFSSFLTGLLAMLDMLHYYIEKASIRKLHPYEK